MYDLYYAPVFAYIHASNHKLKMRVLEHNASEGVNPIITLCAYAQQG